MSSDAQISHTSYDDGLTVVGLTVWVVVVVCVFVCVVPPVVDTLLEAALEAAVAVESLWFADEIAAVTYAGGVDPMDCVIALLWLGDGR
jgi:hypothetical protein